MVRLTSMCKYVAIALVAMAASANAGSLQVANVEGAPLTISRFQSDGRSDASSGLLELVASGSSLASAEAISLQVVARREGEDGVSKRLEVGLATYGGSPTTYILVDVSELGLRPGDEVLVFPVEVKMQHGSWALASELALAMTAAKGQDNPPPDKEPNPGLDTCSRTCSSHFTECRTQCSTCDGSQFSCTCNGGSISFSCNCTGCSASS